MTKPTVASARLSGQGSTLYPSNIPRMLNKDPYSVDAGSFSRTPNALLAGWITTYIKIGNH